MQMSHPVRAVLVALVMLACAFAKGPKKKAGSEGENPGMVTCMKSYLGAYKGVDKSLDENYLGLDYNQLSDEWGSPMFDAWVKPYCQRSTDLPEKPDGDEQNLPLLDPSGLPAATSPCDPDEDYHLCDTYTPPEWKCNISDVNNFFGLLRQILSFEVDDCWTTNGTYPQTFRCEGAPIGPAECTGPDGVTPFAVLPPNQYATGLTMTVDGDRCPACSMKESICPIFLDVHRCSAEWTGVTATPPNHQAEFSFTVTINSGNRVVPSGIMLAIFALLLAFGMS